MMDNKKLMDAIDSLDNDKNYEIKQAAKAAREAKNEDAIKDKNSSDKAPYALIISSQNCLYGIFSNLNIKSSNFNHYLKFLDLINP